jgi:hypothetical protein
MSDQTRAQLQQAYQLIKSGQRQGAIEILQAVLRYDGNNADAWWLLANASTDPAEQQDALETVLRLRPTHEQAREKLAALKGFQNFTFDEPVGFMEADKPKRDIPGGSPIIVEQPRSSGANPLLVILAVIGVVALLLAGACFFIVSQAATQFGQIISTVAESVTDMPGVFATMGALSGEQELSNVDDLEMMGSISRGGSESGTLRDSFSAHGYTFQGERGQSVTLEVRAESDNLDSEVSIYDPDGDLVGYNDDIELATNRNSRLTITLPASGTYTIVVSSFASDGAYVLTVR